MAELKVASDLNQAAYEQAVIELNDQTVLDYDLQSYTLRVSLWDAGTAINIMGIYRNCDVFVDRAYRMYEWSIRARDFTVHSHGS